jgi:hypothetical protein
MAAALVWEDSTKAGLHIQRVGIVQWDKYVPVL